MARRRISPSAGRDAVTAWREHHQRTNNDTASQASNSAEPPSSGAEQASHTAATGSATPHTATTGMTPSHPTTLSRSVKATAVRYLLEEIAEAAPGHSVEVRVPPFGVAQCVEGPRHTRGTPPNVVEFDAETWLEVATGNLSWAAAHQQGRITASGSRADISAWLPLI